MRRISLKILKNIEKITVDANPILSGLIKGVASRVFWSPKIKEFATTEFTFNEVRKYIPILANKAGIKEEIIILDLSLLPIKIYQKDFYKDKINKAKELIEKRDPKDVDILALTLKLQIPLWTNDKDFNEIGINNIPTAQLLKIIET